MAEIAFRQHRLNDSEGGKWRLSKGHRRYTRTSHRVSEWVPRAYVRTDRGPGWCMGPVMLLTGPLHIGVLLSYTALDFDIDIELTYTHKSKK